MFDHLMPLISSPWIYVIVFLAVAIDGFLPIVPSEAVVIGLGAMSATGRPNVVALALAVVAGGMAGDRVSYRLGRRASRWTMRGKLGAARAKAERALSRHGGLAILVGRFLPYGRMATAVTSGSVALPRAKFRLFSALAGAAWAAYAIGLGRLGGETFAHSPLLGAVFGMALGLLLGGAHTIVSKRRAAARRRGAAALLHGADRELVPGRR
jgi:membrane-associated protein